MKLCRAEEVLVPHLEVADRLWSRTLGLIGRESLADDQALWIHRCNSVHTFFMRFAIDLVFVDRHLKVRKTLAHIQPGRLVLPVWGASSVFEFNSGFLKRHPIYKGEKLHVDHSLS